MQKIPLRGPLHATLCRSSDLHISAGITAAAPAPPSRTGHYSPPVTCFRRKDSRSMLTATDSGGSPPVPETCLGVAPNSLVQQSVPACPTCSRVRAGATKVETQSSCVYGYYSTARILTQGFLMLKGPGSHRRECRSPLAKIPPSRWLRLNPMIGANPDKYWHQCPERH